MTSRAPSSTDPSDMASGLSPAWHECAVGEVRERLSTTPGGLAPDVAGARLAEYGPNSLAPPRATPWWTVLVDQFRSLVVLLLVAVVVVVLVLGDPLEASAVGFVVVITVALGFTTELRARRTVEALTRLQVHAADVLRNGTRVTIDARDLVPGDVLVLTEGEAVAADARVFEARELRVNEAPLTGESMPMSKRTDAANPADPLPLADRFNMVYKGTLVTSGSGLAYVVGTAYATEIGRVSELVHSVEEGETPLQKKLDVLGRRLIVLTLAVAVLITVMGLAQGRDAWLMVATGIALAVAAIPEGLPVVATIALAVGVQAMARRKALVRRLSAVEALGGVTVVCADKTGTLTTGRMSLTSLVVGTQRVDVEESHGEPRFSVDGIEQPVERIAGLEEILRTAVLANRASVSREGESLISTGDPTEVALLRAGLGAGMERARLLDRWPEIGSVPFTSDRMYMATFHQREPGRIMASVKGAPGRIVGLCSHRRVPRPGAAHGSSEPLDGTARAEIEEWNRRLCSEGLRVLAVATRELDPMDSLDASAIGGMTFLGLVSISDPPAPMVRETLAKLHGAGIRTIMITGDQAHTAEAVARAIGLDDPIVVQTGSELNATPEGPIPLDVNVFARVVPADKLAIVRGLQAGGQVVAMLGDGVNDAPAIKQADIGVAMGGRGTDVAKETADLVLQDDRFETIGVAVEEGRVIFENIRKFVFYLFSCNLSEVGVLSLAAFSSLPPPLVPLQILWLNLVTDVFPALALAMEPAEEDLLERPPRDPSAVVLSRSFAAHVVIHGLVLTIACGGAFLYALLTLRVSVSAATTVAFQTLALSQLFHVLNARTVGPLRLADLFSNRWMIGAAFLTIALQAAAVTHPLLIDVLSTVHYSEVPWTTVMVAALLPLVFGQAFSAYRHRHSSDLPA